MRGAVQLVKDPARLAASEIPASTWYLFGSALNDKALFNDIDLLAICSTHADARRVREVLAALTLALPIHLLLLTVEEESGTAVCVETRCEMIAPCIHTAQLGC